MIKNKRKDKREKENVITSVFLLIFVLFLIFTASFIVHGESTIRDYCLKNNYLEYKMFNKFFICTEPMQNEMNLTLKVFKEELKAEDETN